MTTALLLSGGMDSLAIAWWKRPEIAVTVDYGQRAATGEKRAAAQVCCELRIRHELVTVDCRSLGSGDMSEAPPDAEAKTSDWWPYRNQMLVTLASMRAISLRVKTLYIGTVRGDGESHLDGSETFVRKLDELMSYQEGGMRIIAPAIGLSTAELVREAGVPAELLAWAHSCHKADIACGACRGCYKYLATYRELGPGYAGAG
jgi:7-cyano-7-deazaguanine synthase